MSAFQFFSICSRNETGRSITLADQASCVSDHPVLRESSGSERAVDMNGVWTERIL
jgi:hypothetical protein